MTKPTCLLLYLACRGGWVSRDELAELFRPEADEATARHTLRLTLSRAKRFPWAQLDVEVRRLRWTPPNDLAQFRAALGRSDWAAALQLYRGPLLHGFVVRDTPGFEDFVETQHRAVENAWRAAALRRAQDLESSAPQGAVALLAHVLERDLLAEDVVQSYLRLSYRSGGREEALRLYAAFRDRLAAELGLAPLAETEALAALIRRAAVDMPPVLPGRHPSRQTHSPDGAARAAVSAAGGGARRGTRRFPSESAARGAARRRARRRQNALSTRRGPGGAVVALPRGLERRGLLSRRGLAARRGSDAAQRCAGLPRRVGPARSRDGAGSAAPAGSTRSSAVRGCSRPSHSCLPRSARTARSCSTTCSGPTPLP